MLERRTRVPVVEFDKLQKAHDKWQSVQAARSVGIDTPTSYLPSNSREVEEISKEIEYPCVLKPRRGAGAVGLRYLHSPEALRSEYRSLQHASDDVFDNQPLIQEFIPGEIHDVCLLFNRGEPRAALTQKRIRMFPPGGGFGIFNETTEEPQLMERAIELMRSLDWHGPALVEFRVEPKSGVPYFIEANARFWGTLDLATEAGIDFPSLTCRMAMDGDIEPVFKYRVGLRYKWAIPHGIRYAMAVENKWRSLWEFLRWERDARSDFRIHDPLPFMVKTLLAVGQPLNRLLRRESDHFQSPLGTSADDVEH
jgi:predicted ATP-grasp superfamily ATP-dependent carboligase